MRKKHPNHLNILPNWQQRPSYLADTTTCLGGLVLFGFVSVLIDTEAMTHLNLKSLTQNFLHQSPKKHCPLQTSSVCARNFLYLLACGSVTLEPDLLSLNGPFGLDPLTATLCLSVMSFSLSVNLPAFSVGRRSATSFIVYPPCLLTPSSVPEGMM